MPSLATPQRGLPDRLVRPVLGPDAKKKGKKKKEDLSFLDDAIGGKKKGKKSKSNKFKK